MLTVKNLFVSFRKCRAVRNVSFSMQPQEALGIVGESGCGKSATVQAIAGLSPGEVTGTILAPKLGREIGMVFQDPMSALNPTMRIGDQIAEGLIYHKLASHSQALARALELLHLTGVPEPEARMRQYPHQLSGGMRQRVLIAIAIACHPRLLIADEPTTALDAVHRAQILALLRDMRKRFQMGLLLISHDFEVIASVCDNVLVMYAGQIVERGPVEEILRSPKHPYTQMLLSCWRRYD